MYPEEGAAVRAALDSYGLIRDGGKAAAIIAPHGAWELSGAAAMAAFSAAAGRARGEQKKCSTVVILGSIHGYEKRGLFLSDSRFFETPLGRLPVDSRLSEELASCSTLFEINDIPHLREHSIEVLLPFIQYCFEGVKIVPILMGQSRGDLAGGSGKALIAGLGRALHIVFKRRLDKTLFVVSSNLSRNNDEGQALVQAEEYLRLLEERSPKDFTAAVLQGRLSACGAPLMAALLESGLLDHTTVKPVSGPLVKAAEKEETIYCGSIAFI
ncbi:MEMO1 family protein [Spirochaetia bacterium]|nr:MEMO1 family protein [Spirochaetia bacterium]